MLSSPNRRLSSSFVVWALVGLIVALALALTTTRAARADTPPPMSSRTISLPGGAASMKGLGESFSPNLSTGAGSFTVPITLPPGLTSPALSLRYTNGHGRSELGASFHLPILQIYRTKDKGSPSFTEADRFAVSGPELNDELVRVDGDKGYYRLKNEGSFALFVRDRDHDSWTIRFANGDRALLGADETTREYSVRGAFKWLVKTHTDVAGQRIEYEYTTDAGYVYLRAIRYQLQAVGYENRVDLTYEYRGDPFTDYGYGSPVTCRQRLTSLAVSSGCGPTCARRTIRTYLLTYELATQSLLHSVQLVGEGGTDALPTITFGYAAPSRSLGRTVTMSPSIPLDLVDTGRAQFDDVNGDGLPDLLVGTAGNYSYYENKTGLAWSGPTAIARSPDVSLDDATSGVVLTDVNGDGFRDVLRASSGGYTYFPGGNVHGGRLVAFLPPVTVSTRTGALLWSDKTLRLADLNFDGRTDLLRADGAHGIKDLNVRDAQGEHVVEVVDGDLPLDVARFFNDPSLQMIDFNGDGAQDFVKNEISGVDSRVRVFYGLGGAKYAEGKVVQAPAGNPGDFLFGDINSDGYVDLVRYTGTQVVYWLGAGDERWIGPIGPSSVRGAPSRVDVRAVHLIDMDGSGTSDLVLLTKTNRVVFASFFSTSFLNLLTSVDNGMGLVTTIGYRSSTDFAVDAKEAGTPWRTTLPKAIAVVADVTVTDSFDRLGMPATAKHTTYEYADGYFDGKEREFRGFGFTRVTVEGDDHAEGKVTETWMHLGVDPDTGLDEEILKGKPYREIVKNGNGEIYSSIESHWEPRWVCAEDAPELQGIAPACAPYPRRDEAKDSLVALAVEPWVLRGTWEKTATPRYALEVTVIDAWGKPTRQTRYGEVAFAGPRAVGDPVDLGALDLFTGDDEVVETTQYVNDTAQWILGLPSRAEKHDARTDALLSAVETYYDGDPFVGLPLGQVAHGKVSRQRALLTQEARWIDHERYGYDDLDLLTESLDPNGNHSALEYDPETRSHVVKESIDVGGGAIVFRARYDAAQATMVESTDPDGNVTSYQYDGLGRLRAVVDPDSTAALPTTTYDYTFGTSGAPVSQIRERHLLDRATQRYRTEWHYLDAEGRTRETKTRNDGGDGYIATGWTTPSTTGANAFQYRAFPTASLGIELPPAGTPRTEAFVDALERPTATYPPAVDGRSGYVLTRYLPFEHQVFDEEDTATGDWSYPAVTRTDGLGRTRSITRYNDYASDASGARARRALTWAFQYDAFGKILAWSDPNGNRREYAYDSLSRLTDSRDPNAGLVHHAYDDAANLVLRVDALGQERRFTYGPANRPLQTVLAKDAHGRPDATLTFHYDTPQAGGPLPDAANTRGKLTWIEWPTGSEHLSYDRHGRVASEAHVLWDGVSPLDAQVRDTFRRGHDYNAAGWPVRARLPGGRSLVSSFNDRGKLLAIGDEAGGAVHPLVSAIDYDADGNTIRTAAGNGTAGCAWYNARSEVMAVASGAAGAVSCAGDPRTPQAGAFQQLVYDRNPSRTIARITDLSKEGGLPRLDAEYGYDRLHELIAARTARGTDAYQYDAIQNVTQHTSTVPGTKALLGDLHYAEAGAGPNMLTGGGGAAFTYDAVGELASLNGYALEFDASGLLIAARKPGGATIRHYYDARGDRRVTVVERPGAPPEVHRFVFDDYQVRAGEEVWIAGSGRLATEIRRPAGDAESVRYTYDDHLTSTTHVTDESGTIVGFQQFGPYGELLTRIASGAPLHGFAGALNEPEEDVGLLRFGARYYAPAMGRWISADGMIAETPTKALERPLEAGLFAYVANDPVNTIDPDGHQSQPRLPVPTQRPVPIFEPPPPEKPRIRATRWETYNVPTPLPEEIRSEKELPKIPTITIQGRFAPRGGYVIRPYNQQISPRVDENGVELEAHHGILTEMARGMVYRYSEGAAPTILMTKEQHRMTVEMWETWKPRLIKAGVLPTRSTPKGATVVDWNNVSPQNKKALSEFLMDNIEKPVPKDVQGKYFESFEIYKENQAARREFDQYDSEMQQWQQNRQYIIETPPVLP